MSLNLNYKPMKVVDTDGMPNDVWLKHRTTGIGGSDVPAIYESSPWTTKRSLYYAKTGLSKGPQDNQFTLDFGHAVEPFVAQWFESVFETKYKRWLEHNMRMKIKEFHIYKDTFMYRHPLYPFMLADLDYRWYIINEKGTRFEGVFECKTTSYNIFPDKWKKGIIPLDYTYQTRHYMAVMNLPCTIIACVCGNNEADYAVGFIKRDLDEEEKIILEEKDFWENYVVPRVEPKLSQEHSDLELETFDAYAITQHNELDTSNPLPLQAQAVEVQDAVKGYLKAKQKRDAYKDKVKEQEKLMKLNQAILLDRFKTGHGCFDDGSKIYAFGYESGTRTGVDSKKLKADNLYDEYSKTSQTESFALKVF